MNTLDNGSAKSILVVDDEATIREVIRRYLERDGFTVREAADGYAALDALAESLPDLLVLDLMLPGIDGLTLTRQIRTPRPNARSAADREALEARHRLPIIMLTARGETSDRIRGLDLGADDYVAKPFSPQELVSRVRAVLRRAGEPTEPAGQALEFDELHLDPVARSVSLRGEVITLTAKEFDLLWFFARHPRQVFSRTQLLDSVWGQEFVGDPSTVTVHIRRLREKIEADASEPRYLLTVWGVGYKLKPDRPPVARTPRPLTYLLGILAVAVVTVALFVALMRPPFSDLMYLVLLFAITGGGSALIGLISHQLGWWRRFGSLAQTLTLGYVIAAALTLFNVWLTARMMFLNQHDLTLAGLLLVFAGGISVSFGYFVSAAITHILRNMAQAAERVSEGDFSVRVNVTGRDEVAQLAAAFNGMAARLEQADHDQRALDSARRDLVAWASHDLRTPLASLRAMLDALADGVVSDPETVARYLQQSQAEIGRMSALIDDLFELAQLDTGNLVLRSEASALSDLISDTLEGFTARALARQVTLTGQVGPGVDPLWMAPDKIGRVLRNLVENAIRHTPPGGHIELRAEAHPTEVEVTVRDTGEGIAPADLPRVFDRFYRGDAARSRGQPGEGLLSGGAGLGLAIARGLVEAHGGRIWVHSALGQGTTIGFALPKQV